MTRRRVLRRTEIAWGLAVALLIAGAATNGWAAAPTALIDAPYFKSRVADGSLPPIAQRVPAEPALAEFSGAARPGRHGGRLRLLMGRPRDVRMMIIYGYGRLIGYDRNYRLVPDILKSFEVKEERIFTLRLRRGHRWSDGTPFTTEDFRYYWDHVATHPKLAPKGLPDFLLVDGEPPEFEVLDPLTVRFTWRSPNPRFLPSLAAASPRFIYRPAHYLKQFHWKFANRKELKAQINVLRLHDWTALHDLKDNQYRFDNPDLPTLQPWVNRTYGPAQRYRFTRNPYFHRVDGHGRQLPYIDEVVMRIAGPSLIPAKTAGGETDLQARYLQFSDYTFLKAAEKRSGYRVNLWRTARGAHLALYPNLNVRDPVWRDLFWKAKFRRALSLGINRHEINQVLYYGLSIEGNNSVLPGSPLYQRDYRFKWTKFDAARANRMLDQLGLTKRNHRGIRLLPDGRPMEIIVETSGEHTEQSDVLELVHDSWQKIGIKLFTKPSQREVFRRRIISGEAQMSISTGLNNGMATQDMTPRELAPDNPYQWQWPVWGRLAQAHAPNPVPLAPVKRLLALAGQWRVAADETARRRIWREMLAIHAEEVFTIGLIAGVRHPVVVRRGLNNVPTNGIYHWNPGAYFGIYRMDGFWFSQDRRGG